MNPASQTRRRFLRNSAATAAGAVLAPSLLQAAVSVTEQNPWPEELDAVRAAPKHHRVILENDRVRVLDTRIAPGDTVPLHTHRWPAVHHIQSWSDFVRRDADGQVLVDTRGKPAPANLPAVLWGAALAPHTLENVGSAELHVVSVEIKDGSTHGPEAKS